MKTGRRLRVRLGVRVRFLLILLQLLIFNFSLLIETPATIRYVSKTGNSTPPYTSWATAADSIQKCINICEDGDAIYVANGVYREYLRINRIITLIGSSMDSTVIDGTGLSDTTVFIDQQTSFVLSNFTVLGKGLNIGDAIFLYSNLSSPYNQPFEISNCLIKNTYNGIWVGGLLHAKNVIIMNIKKGISINWINNDKISIVENSIIHNPSFYGIDLGKGLYIIRNNILLKDEEVDIFIGIKVALTQSFIIQNNLISGFNDNIYVDIVYDTSYIINNVLTHSGYSAFTNYSTGRANLYNSIIKNSSYLGTFTLPATKVDYNLFYQNNRNFYYAPQDGDSNLINIDPMLVNDIKPSLTNNWDYHLQAYSPAINKGDPSILDPNGSRSDMGMYGGPFGEVYTYQDLAPRPPRNLSAIVDSGRVRLRWNKNTEADTSHYNIYRSLTSNFVIDSTKLIGSTTDTSFADIIGQEYERLYYKITCVDKQGNQSQPSEELMVNLTSINEYPTLVNDYYLYQNYPNPFNPTTKIGYKLKERGYVKLMVYDIKGELVAVLVNQEQEAGYYEVEFDANSLRVGSKQLAVGNSIASGIYLYRIEVIGEGNIPVYTDMRKMVLVK
uniref:Fibronectin type-III domain-containing protein n=1 Tax=Ignavibacterium album TaxID=591197 RepID=A0A7V2ZMN7_9BACT